MRILLPLFTLLPITHIATIIYDVLVGHHVVNDDDMVVLKDDEPTSHVLRGGEDVLEKDDEKTYWNKHNVEDENNLISSLVGNLTLTEKLQLLHGAVDSRGYTGYVEGVKRLGIPSLRMNDGPQGYRGPSRTSTAWPCSLALAASFSRELVSAQAKAMAREFAIKNSNVFLGPGVNLARIPTNGRNFEYLSGEDPFLGEELVYEYVKGIQSWPGMMATVKHYVNNNQETNRGSVSAQVSAETEWNLYYRPFLSGVRAGAHAFMCSYNKINGVAGCSSNQTLNTDLRQGMGFRGFVMSDWFAARDTVEGAQGGMDVEMPVPLFYGESLRVAVQQRKVNMAVVDQMVTNVLTSIVRVGGDLRSHGGGPTTNATSAAHNMLARRASAESIVLLKNANDFLPLKEHHHVVVIGDRAHNNPITTGGGSGHVQPPYVVTPLQGLITAGFSSYSHYIPSGKVGSSTKSLISSASAVVIVVGTVSTEGFDRPNLSLDEDDMVNQVAKWNSHVVVCVIAPGAVLLPWSKSPNITSILLQFMPGQEGGNALADVLTGRIPPTGRLPITLPNKENEINMTRKQYPGINLVAEYSEGVEIGYRWYLRHGVRPHFPFGFGLSYGAKWKYVGVRHVRSTWAGMVLAVECRVGMESTLYDTVQVYASLENEKPSHRVLVAFKRVQVSWGERLRGKVMVSLEVPWRAVSTFNAAKGEWNVHRRGIHFFVGSDVEQSLQHQGGMELEVSDGDDVYK